MINRPMELVDAYLGLWKSDAADALEHDYKVREQFNLTQEPKLFLYLLASILTVDQQS